jgi:hypothetical protein
VYEPGGAVQRRVGGQQRSLGVQQVVDGGTTLAARVTPLVPAMAVNPAIVLLVPVSMAASISRAVRSTMAWPITVAMASTLWRTSSLEIR